MQHATGNMQHVTHLLRCVELEVVTGEELDEVVPIGRMGSAKRESD
jgi:hypothetical protein